MAEAFLEEIYEEAALVCQLKQAVEYAKIHDELHMIAICNAVFQPLCKICKIRKRGWRCGMQYRR